MLSLLDDMLLRRFLVDAVFDVGKQKSEGSSVSLIRFFSTLMISICAEATQVVVSDI